MGVATALNSDRWLGLQAGNDSHFFVISTPKTLLKITMNGVPEPVRRAVGCYLDTLVNNQPVIIHYLLGSHIASRLLVDISA